MQKIAVATSKGGTGKSTTAVSLAAALAATGKRVLLLDLDTQGQASVMLGAPKDDGAARLIIGDATADEAVTQARDNLWLMAGGQMLAQATQHIARQDFQSELVLTQALSRWPAGSTLSSRTPRRAGARYSLTHWSTPTRCSPR